MTPGQRGNYLTWLASGKQGQLDDIGYAFVYFYGLEWRVFIDGKDVDLIIPEVVRLLCRYPEIRLIQWIFESLHCFFRSPDGAEIHNE